MMKEQTDTGIKHANKYKFEILYNKRMQLLSKQVPEYSTSKEYCTETEYTQSGEM